MPKPQEIITASSAETWSSLPAEWPTASIEAVDQHIKQVGREIRLFYYRQLPLLRQIPYLALEANGRGGWQDEWRRAYDDCMMAIHQGEHGYDMLIELRTGSLLAFGGTRTEYIFTGYGFDEYEGETTIGMATDTEVYNALAHAPLHDRFDPVAEMEFMKKRAKNKYHNDPKTVEEAIRRKEQTKKDLDLMMAKFPMDAVIKDLRAKGFEV